MSILAKFPSLVTREAVKEATDDEHTAVTPKMANTSDKEAGFVNTCESKNSNDTAQLPSEDAQTGVQEMQAITMAWTKTTLILFLIMLWFLYLTNGFRTAILYSLTPYATSSFGSHSLLTLIKVVSGAMASALYIPVAKMLDVWGRAEGFLVMVVWSTLGMVLMAASNNIETFCAAQIFYAVGFGGLNYSIVVLAADATNLKNRGLAFAFTSSPYMVTAFAGSKASEAFLKNVNWRWGFGAFAIIYPFVALPVYLVLKFNLHKAEKQGLLNRVHSGRTFRQNVSHWVVEFDLPGVTLFAGGLTLFLLPFTLAARAPNGWKTDYIIAMIVVGAVFLTLFALYSKYLSPSPFLNHDLLFDRTVMGACLLDFTYQVSYYCWNSYFSSFLQVVNNLTVAEAGYVGHTFSVVSGVLLFIVGFLIRQTGRFRWLLIIGVPLYIFAQGLMIYFRKPNGHIGYIIMCEVFISMGGCVFILCMQLAVLAAVDHQHVAAALSVLFVFGTVGGAVGNAISGAIWTNTFSKALKQNLPETALPRIPIIMGSIVEQLKYDKGTPERLAIQKAYGYAQTRMLAVGTAIMTLSFIWVFMMRDYNVKKMTQTKGNTF